MLYRLLATVIVLFWLTMTGLLVRKEFGLGDSSLREVPIAHVAKLLFTHEQPSDLQVYNERLAVGRLRIQPRLRKEDGQRKVDFTGTVQLLLPGVDGRQRVAWTGDLTLDSQLQAQRLKFALTYRAPAPHTLDLALDFPQKRVSYETRVDAIVAHRGEFSFDEAGVSVWLREQGIDPALVKSLSNPNSAPMQASARQASLTIRDEKIDTWLVSVEQGGQTMLEAHVSQLGQILRLRTFLGYSAAPEDLAP